MKNETEKALPILTFRPAIPSGASAKAVFALPEAPKRLKFGSAET
jgi:hypothetical protein